MHPHPILSILSPAHNRGHFLDETIESVLSQTLGDFELFVIDNASTDETLA
jgi:glycosyltransferase involved in cell wall biosynthesis